MSVNTSSIPKIPKCLRIRTVTNGLVSYDDAKTKFQDYYDAAHTLIWSKNDGSSVFGKLKANVMMQLRFDGSFGFPGGKVDDGEDILEGLNRELAEEINWDIEKCCVTWNDYYCTQIESSKRYRLHFFITEIPVKEYEELERKCLAAKEYGLEVMGTIRVPLYTMDNHYSGLPAFLNNRFIGTAKQQLLLALHHKNIISEEELEEVLYFSQNMKLAPNRL